MTKKKKLCFEQFLNNQQWWLATVLLIFFMLTVDGNWLLVPDFLGRSQFCKALPEVVPLDKRIHEWEREKNSFVDRYILIFRFKT